MNEVISVNVDEFEGDVSVKRNINLGGNITAQGNAHIKKNLRVDGYIDCPNFKGPNKGLFNDLDSLKESYPNPIDGWWALVGNTLPAQLFIVVNGEWCDSGFVVGDGLEIDLTDINEMIEKLQDSLANISSPILPFYGIYNTSDDFKIIDTSDGILREEKVVYFIDKKRFYLLYGQYIIEQWSDSWQYMNENMPRGDRLYVMNNRLYQYDGTSLVLLGSNGISPFDIVQNRGNSKEKAMSQDAVSRELENIESMIDMPLPIFDGVAPSGIELNEKSANLDNGSILFSAELGSFVCLVGEKYYASWLDTNGTRKVELYNIYDIKNKKTNAVTNKLFICNNKLYFFNGENLIELSSEIPSSAFNQNKSLSIDANGNIKWKSIIPAFYEIITESTPVTEVRLSEYNNSDNIIYFLSNAHFANLSKVFPIFAKKNIYGEYIIPNTYNSNIDEYNYKKDGSISPIQNKIYECITNKQQYYFDGKTLRLLSDNHLKYLTYAELRTLIENSLLIPGMQYRITDYTYAKQDGSLTFVGDFIHTNISTEDTITVNYRGRGYMFDLIVTADSNNSINAEARVVQHEYAEGETPNILINRDFSKWKVKYDIENNTNKYEWADTDGKGVIYELEDEFGNRCPYDFVNIEYTLLPNDYYPTFSAISESGNVHHNIIEPYIKDGVHRLNVIMIEAMSCFNNKFGNNCYLITNVGSGSAYFKNNEVKDTCYNASFGRNAKNITINANCSNWSIGDNCYSINIGVNNDRWIVGYNCHNITTGSLNSDWTVGKYCMYITTGNHTWSWTCEDYTSSWTAGDSCIGFIIGSGFTREEEDYYIFEKENINVTIETGAEYFLCRGLTNGVVPSSIKGALEYLIELSSLYNHTLYVKIGGETPELIEISYSAFINKKRNNILIPGKQYLISDYHTFYYKDQYPNMCEVSPTLPIIVTADSKNTISPYARLADGSAEIRVELYDDYKFPKREAQYLYEGTKCTIEESSNVVSYNDEEYIELYLKVMDSDDIYYYIYVVKTEWEEVIAKYRYSEGPYNIQGYSANSEILASHGLFAPKGTRYDAAGEYNILQKSYSQHKYLHEIPKSRGMGEITWMKDENGNEAPFDFKSVRWYFTEEEINNFDNKVFENGETITGLTQYFTPNTPTPTFNGKCKNNVIIFKYGIVPIIVQDSHDNKIFIESNTCLTFVRLSYYSELHSQSTVNIHPFLQQQYCYSKVYQGTLNKTPYSPVGFLGESDSLTVSQKTITKNFDSINEKIDSNCAILPITKIDSDTPNIDSVNKPSNPFGVYLIPLKNCLAAFNGSCYYSNWDAFTYNNVYYPSSKEYNKGSILLRDISNISAFGSKLLVLNNKFVTNITGLTTDITEKLFVAPQPSSFSLVSGYNYFCNADLSNITTYTISFYPQTNISTPIKTSRVIIIGSKVNNIIFNIPSSSNRTTIWENGEPPIIEIGKYYIFDFTEMFVPTSKKTTIFITYKSISPNKVEDPNPDYVDLGLPSGTLWATKNVGATSPEEYGNYYAWGEIETKEEYLSDNCSTSGIALDDISGNSQYDAATANLDTTWKMPTKLDLEELINNCTLEATTLNSVNGYKIVGPNGNSIFVPSGGYKYSTESNAYVGVSSYYWSSTPDNNYQAYELKVNSDTMIIESSFREYGFNIRPIKIITEPEQS